MKSNDFAQVMLPGLRRVFRSAWDKQAARDLALLRHPLYKDGPIIKKSKKRWELDMFFGWKAEAEHWKTTAHIEERWKYTYRDQLHKLTGKIDKVKSDLDAAGLWGLDNLSTEEVLDKACHVLKLQNERLEEYRKKEYEEQVAKADERHRINEARELLKEGLVPKEHAASLRKEIFEHLDRELSITKSG